MPTKEAFCSYVNVPVLDMRAEPFSKSEVVSQALFSEPVRLLQEDEGWLKIFTLIDNYPGWVRAGTLCQRALPFPVSNFARIKVSRCAAHVYQAPHTIYGPLLTLPFESLLQVVEPISTEDSRWIKVALPDGQEGFIQRGDISFNFEPLDLSGICDLSQRFLGLPYTWGGRSSFGFDCSGFVQMLYRQMGIYLPRDSKTQCGWSGFREVAIESICPGDLIFFGFSLEKIRHVGMYLGENQFIHTVASVENAPFLRISHLSDPAWNGSGHYPFFTARSLHL